MTTTSKRGRAERAQALLPGLFVFVSKVFFACGLNGIGARVFFEGFLLDFKQMNELCFLNAEI